jgi:hypothetical protein
MPMKATRAKTASFGAVILLLSPGRGAAPLCPMAPLEARSFAARDAL